MRDNTATLTSSDADKRQLQGLAQKIFLLVACCWSLFQLYVASNIPYTLSAYTGLNLALNSNDIRIIHLAFALALVALVYPLWKRGMRSKVAWYDILFSVAGATCCLYLLINKAAIADRAGLPTTLDLWVSGVGLFILATAVLRSLGWPLLIVVAVFVLYVFFGDLYFLPDVIQWKGASVNKTLWHYWMQTEGVFGKPLDVAASMIFLFVLFGALLEKAGAGQYFIQLAFALLGRFRGGPAKAAVLASALSGVYSGSSIANVVTTGTFTIPLMKKSGFKAEKAGAVEVAASTNGQLTPPVMGAAAFLIAEFSGVSYPEIIKHALLPALISYIALIYIVHLEAVKQGMQAVQSSNTTLQTFIRRSGGVLLGFIVMMLLFVVIYYVLSGIKAVLPGLTFYLVVIFALLTYLLLLFLAAAKPDLEQQFNQDLLSLKISTVTISGLHYLLPIVILIWCITIERLSPTLSAFWATLFMLLITLTQHPLKAFFRQQSMQGNIKRSLQDAFAGMVAGANNMISIAVATAAAGIIVGSVALTGAHQVIGAFVELLSGGNLMLMLILVALMSLILGMGLPTTANYIVVSSLMVPVIVSVGAESGLIVPLIAVHLFVFYFGILADDTPPVGLAAYAAAAISGGRPIKTGVQGFIYDMRTALLPFLFIFNTELLLIDVTLAKAVLVFIVAVIAMLLFVAATQGYFLRKNTLWESALLLLIAFTLFRPGFWLDQIQPPFNKLEPTQLQATVDSMPIDGLLRLELIGTDFDYSDQEQYLTVMVPLPEANNALQRLAKSGLAIKPGTVAEIDEPLPGTPFFEALKSFDFYGDSPVRVLNVQAPAQRLAKEIFYIPALLLLIALAYRQKNTV